MHILTLKVGNKYKPEYVNNLYKSLKDNSTLPFKMHCYTDDISGLHEDIEVKFDYHNPPPHLLQWNKLLFHKTGFFDTIKESEHCLILDIDQTVIGDFDPILSHVLEEGQFGCMFRWWSKLTDKCAINGGFQMFRMGDTNHLYEKFSEDPQYWQEYYIKNDLASGPVNGEQNFIDQHVGDNRHWFPMEWFGKYEPYDIEIIQSQWLKHVNKFDPFFLDGEFSETVKLLHFSGRLNDMHRHYLRSVQQYWTGEEFGSQDYLRKNRQ